MSGVGILVGFLVVMMLVIGVVGSIASEIDDWLNQR